jgi:transcriptional regulator with XRE-family HTH domain
MTFGQRVKSMRLRRGMTQLELAKAIGVSKAAISALETGSSKSATPENVFALADALRCSARQLVFGRDRDEELLLDDDVSITGEYEMLPDADKKVVHVLVKTLSDKNKTPESTERLKSTKK